jgi:hypothetical protein
MPRDLSHRLAVIVPITPAQSRNLQAAAAAASTPPPHQADTATLDEPHSPPARRRDTALRLAVALVALNWIAGGLSWWGPVGVRPIAANATVLLGAALVVLGVHWLRRRRWA